MECNPQTKKRFLSSREACRDRYQNLSTLDADRLLVHTTTTIPPVLVVPGPIGPRCYLKCNAVSEIQTYDLASDMVA